MSSISDNTVIAAHLSSLPNSFEAEQPLLGGGHHVDSPSSQTRDDPRVHAFIEVEVERHARFRARLWPTGKARAHFGEDGAPLMSVPRITGRWPVSLLLDGSSGVVIIDHKSSPGRASEWEALALEYAPRLLAYARALEIAGKPVLAMVVHFTVGGGVVQIAAAGGGVHECEDSSLASMVGEER